MVGILLDHYDAANHYEMVDGAGWQCVLGPKSVQANFEQGHLEDGHVKVPLAQEPLVQPPGHPAVDAVAEPLAFALALVHFSDHDGEVQP